MAEPGGGLISGAAGISAAEIIAALPTPLLVLDPDERVREANAAAENLLNIGVATMRGRPLSDLIVPPLDYVRRTGSDGALALYDQPLMTTRGLRLRVDFLVGPVLDRPGWRVLVLQQGAVTRGLGPARERAGRSAVGAAAMLAHEIKNPLSGIRGAAQLIESEVRGEAQALTRLIRGEVDRIAALIDRMQQFTDERPVPLAAENLYTVLDHVRLVAASGFAAHAVIEERYDPSLPPVLTHRDSLAQLLINLLKNAAEAVADKGLIQIATAYRHGVSVADGSGGRVALPIEIRVSDDGPGVPEDLVEHLFEPFVTTKRGGQGLGLALADKLARDMGGILRYSREDGRTVFRLLLPRAQ